MSRANGSPTCARSPSPSGRPGSNRADGTLSSPRPVSDPTPTATTPNARQPLQEHTPPASRTPPIHVRSNEGRGRILHALRKAQAAPRDHESGSLMQTDPVPIRIPAFPRDPRRPRRIHNDQLDTAPAALPLQRGHHLAGAEIREDPSKAFPVLPQPSLLHAKIEVLRNHRHTPGRSPVADRPRRNLHAVPGCAKLLAARQRETAAARDFTPGGSRSGFLPHGRGGNGLVILRIVYMSCSLQTVLFS